MRRPVRSSASTRRRRRIRRRLVLPQTSGGCRQRCFRRGLRVDADKLSCASLILKLHEAVNQSKERIVFAAPDVLARLPLRAALARQDVAAQNALASKFLESQSL